MLLPFFLVHRFQRRETKLHIGNDAIEALGKIRMDDQGQNSDAEAKSRGDEGFADTAGNGNGLTGLDVKDTERADHAADRPEEPQERRQR